MKNKILLIIFILSTGINYAQNWSLLEKIVSNDRTLMGYFGFSVAISGDFLFVGSVGETKDVSGENSLNLAGAVFIYKKNLSGSWAFHQKIVPSDRAANDRFGYSVAASDDYLIVSARDEAEDVNGNNTLFSAGSAYIFKNVEGTWTQVQKIVASDRGSGDWFGYAVGISGDYITVSALKEDENEIGEATEADAGSAYIFKNTDGIWSQVKKIVASDRQWGDQFGADISISGDYIIVGANTEDEDANGNNTINAAGSAYIFQNIAGNWTQIQKIAASDRNTNDYFGASVSISGNFLVVGALLEAEDADGNNTISGAGSAYIFKNVEGTWTQVQKIVASDRNGFDLFGCSISISGDYIIAGSMNDDDDENNANPIQDAGSAYVFKNNGGIWSQVQKVVSTDRDVFDRFAYDVAVSGDYFVVGNDGDALDANGENAIDDAGSAYIFGNMDVLPVELESFTSSVSGGQVTLHWKTATEVNNYGFEILRSAQNDIWENIGFVAGAGNSNSPKSYSYQDNSELSGKYSYRLKQVDLDGKYSYSKEITVELSAIPTEFSLSQNYPNPFNPVTTIRYSVPVTLSPVTVSLVVYNLLGQEVATLVNTQQPAGNYEVKFDASGISSGVYLYKIQAGEYSAVKKLMLLK